MLVSRDIPRQEPNVALVGRIRRVYIRPMEHNAKVDVRLPSELRSALEQERRRMSKKAGAEVKMSAVIRAILEQAMRSKRQPSSSRAA